MPELFSDEWFDQLEGALDALGRTGVPPNMPEAGLALGQIVTELTDADSPTGVGRPEIRYTIVLKPDRSLSLVRSSIEPADVVLVEDWPTAEAIVSGSPPLADLLAAGRIKLRGSARALIAAGELLAKIAPLLVSRKLVPQRKCGESGIFLL
jgi:hypothetical protein